MLIDLVTHVLHYLPQILLALPCLYWAIREIRTERGWRRVMLVGGVAGLLLAGANLGSSIPHAAGHAWSAARLAPAAGWVRGYRLFYPSGQGPLLVQMYGPVSAMVYLPAVWLAASPTVAVLLGTLTNAILFIAPAIWIIRKSLRHAPLSMTLAIVALFLLLVCRQFVLIEAATRVTIDAPAIAMAVLAMGAVTHASPRSFANGLLCGALAALSLWTKLTLSPIPIAILIYVALCRDMRSAFRFFAGLVVAMLGITALLVICLGPEMILQNVVIPMRQPWQWPALSRGDAYIRALRWIWRYSAPAYWMLLLIIVVAALVPRLRPKRGALRGWARENMWLLPLLACLCVIPTATLAYVKVGGSWKNAVAGSYFALLAAVGLLGRAGSVAVEPGHESHAHLTLPTRIARGCVLSLLIYGIYAAGNPLKLVRGGVDAWRSIMSNEHEQAYRYSMQHPGEVYFPSYPLSTLLAEGKLYHFAAGIDSAEWGREHVDEPWLRRWLPANLQRVLYPRCSPMPPMLDRLAEFDTEVEDPQMPGWVVLTRRAPAP